MSLFGKFHPLLVHFPIGLVLAAAGTEFAATWTRRANWRAVAVANLRMGAAMGALTLIAGWLLAIPVEATPSLTLHRWTGVAAVAVTLGGALASRRSHLETSRSLAAYQSAVFAAAVLMAIAGHLGAALVWGSDFLRP